MNAFLVGVGENLFSSVIFAGLVFVAGFVYLKWGARRIFGFDAHDTPTVVTTALEPASTGRYRRAATGIGPVRALSELSPAYARAYWRGRLDHVFTSDAQLHERREGNLIVLGGEKRNKVTMDVLVLLAEEGSFPVTPTTESNVTWRGSPYASEGDGNELSMDYGLVIRATNPWARGQARAVIVLGGASTHGVHAAARAFVQDRWFRRSGDVAALIQCKVRDDLMVQPRVIARATRDASTGIWRDGRESSPEPRGMLQPESGETNGVNALRGRAFVVTDAVAIGKVDDLSCEDVVGDGANYAVLCDGATNPSGSRFNEKTGGRVAAEIVRDVVTRAEAGLSAPELVLRINEAYAELLGSQLLGLGLNAYPTASFCAIEKRTGRIIRVGDTSWRTLQRELRGHKLIDEARAHTRAALLRCLLLGGRSEEDLLRSDPGWEMNKPLLEHQAHCRNTLEAAEYSYGAIDGRPVPAAFIEEWTLHERERVVVFASDGYPRMFMTLEACETYLANDLKADPLRIGRYATTKGHRPGTLSYDDRSFLRLEDTI